MHTDTQQAVNFPLASLNKCTYQSIFTNDTPCLGKEISIVMWLLILTFPAHPSFANDPLSPIQQPVQPLAPGESPFFPHFIGIAMFIVDTIFSNGSTTRRQSIQMYDYLFRGALLILIMIIPNQNSYWSLVLRCHCPNISLTPHAWVHESSQIVHPVAFHLHPLSFHHAEHPEYIQHRLVHAIGSQITIPGKPGLILKFKWPGNGTD